MAFRFALTYPEKVAGVISLNGVLPRRRNRYSSLSGCGD